MSRNTKPSLPLLPEKTGQAGPHHCASGEGPVLGHYCAEMSQTFCIAPGACALLQAQGSLLAPAHPRWICGAQTLRAWKHSRGGKDVGWQNDTTNHTLWAPLQLLCVVVVHWDTQDCSSFNVKTAAQFS